MRQASVAFCIDAPKGALTSELRQAITEQKLAILTLMQRNVRQLEDVRAVTIVEPPEVEAQETQTIEGVLKGLTR